MPYRKETLPDTPLPCLAISAILYEEGKEDRTVFRFLPPVPGETVSIPLSHIAAHIEIKDHDHYHIKAEVQSTRPHSLAYDGRTVRVGEDEPFCAVFSYPSDQDPIEEIRLTLRAVRTPGGAVPDTPRHP